MNLAALSFFGQEALADGRTIGELLPFVTIPGKTTNGSSRWAGKFGTGVDQERDIDVVRTPTGDESGGSVYSIHDVTEHTQISHNREQLLYSVAHELRGSLSVMDNVLGMLFIDYPPLSKEEHLHLMQLAIGTATRLRRLMENLLSAGNIQSGRFQVDPKVTLLPRITDEAIDAVVATFDARNQHILSDGLDREVPVMADRRYIVQVLANLLMNASKYSPEGADVRLGVDRLNDQVRVTVEDAGQGIPVERLSGLFERFYRARPEGEEPGVGLGLAIVKGIVRAHNGTVGVESEVGVGSRFWFTLPLG
ncbi:MAG: putative Histidine kinase [Chloroflexi bacterium]|nr:putative Histidine kinase [Chloroflexota bacterium]